MSKSASCDVCFRHCEISEGTVGFCGVRTCDNGVIKPLNYGCITSLSLDPIEKKPLSRFHPGTNILSTGSYGCNLRCPFCQNSEISWSKQAYEFKERAEYLSPEELANIAEECRDRGNIGIAFTYNEPLIGLEYVMDTAKLIHDRGMLNVLVTNGTADVSVVKRLDGLIDAMNIDLKGFTDEYYRDVLKGDLQCTCDFIREAVKICHVELTTLIVPGYNDTEEEMRNIAGFIESLTDKDGNPIGKEIPLHISRFFPRFNLTEIAATDVAKVYRLADVAREKLAYVYTGNC
ncbi:MAG: AmmeMemoRadiSam system radical SAM enzyme [Lachnospiraceae bacterium]|nr:AmmeMemoRadiSam system radical SAM enzyme [Lachnospiraceae bacterium]